MAVVQKIISGNEQPNAGRGIVSVAGMAGLGNSGTLITEIASTNFIDPPYANANQLDPPVGWFSYLETRYDDTNYYHGSGVNSDLS
jgi:hypothetical protein